MLSYKQWVLQEGIIKVEDEYVDLIWYKFIDMFTYSSGFYEWMKSYVDKNQKPEILEQFDSFVNEIKKKEKESKVTVYVDGSRSYLRYTSPRYRMENNKLYFQFDYMNSNTGASFDGLSTITINLGADGFINPLNGWLLHKTKINEKNLREAFEEVRNSIEHEIIHFVEFSLKGGPDKKALSKKPDYHGDASSYFTSNVEFETHIVGLVRKFEKIIKYQSNNEEAVSEKDAKLFIKSLINNSKYYDDELPSVLSLNIFDQFIGALKKIKNTSYKVAAKKFYTEAMKSIIKLKEEGYII